MGTVTGKKYSAVKLSQLYVVEEFVGRGQSGVISACRHRFTGNRFACKSLLKETMKSEGRMEEVQREVRSQMGLPSTHVPRTHIYIDCICFLKMHPLQWRESRHRFMVRRSACKSLFKETMKAEGGIEEVQREVRLHT